MENNGFRTVLSRLIYLARDYAADFFKLKEQKDLFKSKNNFIKFANQIGLDSFQKKCYEGFKLAQKDILNAILELEQEIKSYKPIDKNDERIPRLKYQITALKEVANVIAWTIFLNQRTHIKSFITNGMGSGFLSDRNIKSVASLAEEINKDTNKFALITDITSCLGMGDLVIAETDKPIKIAEVKEGKVNEAISNLIDSNLKSDNDDFKKDLLDFYKQYGEKGHKQIQRKLRQNARVLGSIEYIENDEGVDPDTGKYKYAIEISKEPIIISKFLRLALDHLYKNKEPWRIIPTDCCLIGIFRRDTSNSYFTNRMDFKHMVYHELSVPLDKCGFLLGEAEFNKYFKIQIASLRDSIYIPTHPPLYFLGLNDQHLIDLVCEDIDIFIHFNGDRFLEMCNERGLSARWSTDKEFRQGKSNKTIYDFGEKHLYVSKNDIKMPILHGPIYSILYELESGYSVIERIKESLDIMEEKSKS